MANYVYTRVLCNGKAKKLIEDSDWCLDEKNDRYLDKYNLVSKKMANDKYEVKFNSRGMDFADKALRDLILKYNDTEVYCIGEFDDEEIYYSFRRNTVIKEVRKLYELISSNDKKIFELGSFDNCYNWINYELIIYDKDESNILIEEVELNTSMLFTINKEDIEKMKSLASKYVSLLKNKQALFLVNNIEKQEDLYFYVYNNTVDEDGYDYDYANISSCYIGERYININEYLDAGEYIEEIKLEINDILSKNNISKKYLIKCKYLLNNK